jgi:hypothetical protein
MDIIFRTVEKPRPAREDKPSDAFASWTSPPLKRLKARQLHDSDKRGAGGPPLGSFARVGIPECEPLEILTLTCLCIQQIRTSALLD